MSISTKLISLVSAAVLSLTILLCVVAYLLMANFGNVNAKRNLETAKNSMQATVDTLLASQAVFGALLEKDQDLVLAVAEGDSEEVRQIAKRLVSAAAVDLVTICNMEGKVLARGHSDKAGDIIGASRLSVQVPLLEGKGIVGIEPGNEIRLTLAAGTPIYFNKRQVGVAVIGTDLSSGKLVRNIKDALGVEGTVFLKDTRVATTVERDGQPIINTQLNNPQLYNSVVKHGETVITKNMILNEEYDTIYWPWEGMDKQNGGMFFVGLSRASITSAQNTMVTYFIAVGGIVGAILIGLGVLVSRALVRPLIQTTAYAQEVAQGNFDRTLAIASADEVGTLARSLSSMVSNLKAKIAESEENSHEALLQAEKATKAMEDAEIAKGNAESRQTAILEAAAHVERVVDRLRTSAASLGKQVEASSESADMQREQVASSATAMEEMNATTLEVARSAATAAEGAERAKEKATAGAHIVKDSIEAFSSVQAETEALRLVMNALGKEAEGISEVMTVINDIADQTNLLALNAAIEAARAGEAGRGFAVVADEVRKLAEKTMTATNEVGAVINSIQQGTRKSITCMDNTGNKLAAATDLVHNSGKSLEEIVQESMHMADQVRNIATASEEQSAASEEITRSLEAINQSAGDTVNTMHQSKASVQDVNEDVAQLQNLVQKLRTGS